MKMLQVPCLICKRKKITYFDLHVIVKEDVSQFQVSVDDSVVVQVLDTLEQLCHVVASLGLSHSLTTLVQLQQRLKWRRNIKIKAMKSIIQQEFNWISWGGIKQVEINNYVRSHD